MNSLMFSGQRISPSKIVCIGRNYVAHAKELGNEIPTEPVIFIKPNSSISTELRSGIDEPIHYEGELCFLVIKQQLAAVGFGLDLTKRQSQQILKKKGLPWERAKAFDGAAVFSDFIAIKDEQIDQLSLKLSINGQAVQQGGVNMMLFTPRQILKEISCFITLEDGDIIMTGTPEGVGEVHQGSVFEAQIYSNEQQLLSSIWEVVQ